MGRFYYLALIPTLSSESQGRPNRSPGDAQRRRTRPASGSALRRYLAEAAAIHLGDEHSLVDEIAIGVVADLADQ